MEVLLNWVTWTRIYKIGVSLMGDCLPVLYGTSEAAILSELAWIPNILGQMEIMLRFR